MMLTMQRYWMTIGAGLGLLAVAAGAFGAHGLEDVLDERALANWETAAKYQMYHALALVLTGLLPLAASRNRERDADGAQGGNACAKPQAAAGMCFTVGTVIFSGTLYLLSVTGIRWLGAITPIGGVLLMVGWAALAVAGWKASRCPR